VIHARALGFKVVTVSSVENARLARATHSSGKKLADLGDVVIDNRRPPQDALVEVEGAAVTASSTLAVVAICMALVAETAARLAGRGVKVRPFVLPNLGANPDHNRQVFDECVRARCRSS